MKQEEKQKKGVEAIVNIYTSFNNTLVHVTDMSGKTLAKVTGGMVTKHDRLKANPTIAMFVAKRISENIKDLNVKSVYVRIRAKTRNPAPGPGANTIIKTLSREGFKILNIFCVFFSFFLLFNSYSFSSILSEMSSCPLPSHRQFCHVSIASVNSNFF